MSNYKKIVDYVVECFNRKFGKKIYGMRTSNSKKIVDYVVECFNREFGNDMVLIERTEAFYLMGCFALQFLYVPLKYTVEFVNDRGFFDIYISDEKGAQTDLDRICPKNKDFNLDEMNTRGNYTKSPEDIENKVSKLKKILERNDFSFLASDSYKH